MANFRLNQTGSQIQGALDLLSDNGATVGQVLVANGSGGANYQTPDSAMSDTSENLVQNKTIKAYIDGIKTEIENAITGGAW